MKKIAFLFSALLALGFTACDDSSDLGKMQTNPQEAVMSAGGITVDFGDNLKGSALDLNSYIVDDNIKVISLADAPDLPEGADVSFEMQLASKEDYSDASTFEVENGSVKASDWDAWFRSTLGKSPAPKDNYVRFAAYITQGSVVSRVGGPDTWFAAKKLTVTPVPLEIKIEEAYYWIGTGNGWQLDTTFPFKHSDVNVYDDPVFTVAIEVSEEQAAEGYWWKVVPKSGIENQDWEVCVGPALNGDTSLSGMLVDKDAQAGVINEAGSYIVTINMMDMTYSIDKMTYLYTPGNSNGWSHDASQRLAFDAESGVFTGFAYLDGEFKFTSAPNWEDGTNYGSTGTDGTLSTDPGAGNLNAGPAGLYYCEVNVDALTYKLTPVTTWGLIGDFNGWASSVAMTPSADFLTWEGEVDLEAGKDWKFRANDGWDINLGGELTKLVMGGGNLTVTTSGKYHITLNLGAIPYTASAVKK